MVCWFYIKEMFPISCNPTLNSSLGLSPRANSTNIIFNNFHASYRIFLVNYVFFVRLFSLVIHNLHEDYHKNVENFAVKQGCVILTALNLVHYKYCVDVTSILRKYLLMILYTIFLSFNYFCHTAITIFYNICQLFK